MADAFLSLPATDRRDILRTAAARPPSASDRPQGANGARDTPYIATGASNGPSRPTATASGPNRIAA